MGNLFSCFKSIECSISNVSVLKMAAKKKIVRGGVRIMCQHLITAIKKQKNRKPRRWWVREWILKRSSEGASAKLLVEWATGDLDAYKNHLRMSEEKFEELLKKVSPFIQKKTTLLRESLSAKLKLHVVLRYLATGDSFSSLGALYRLPKNTISQFLPDVCKAIYNSLEEFIKVRLIRYNMGKYLLLFTFYFQNNL